MSLFNKIPRQSFDEDIDAPGELNIKPDGGAGATTLNKRPLLLAGVALCVVVGGAYAGFSMMRHPAAQQVSVKVVPGKPENVNMPPPVRPVPPQLPATAPAGDAGAPVVPGTAGTAKTPPPAPVNNQPSPQDQAEQQAFSSQLDSNWGGAGGAQAPQGQKAIAPATAGSAAGTDGENGLGVYNIHLAHRPVSPYELMAGNAIPAVLTTALESDLAGQVTAQVTRNVFDSESGAYLLIPAGAQLVGTYGNQVIAGQTRVGVDWTRIIFPNGSYVSLGKMNATDSAGETGLADQVNNHTWKIFKSALLMSIIDVAVSVSQPGYASAGYGSAVSPTQEAEASLSSTFGQAEIQILKKFINIAPTLTIRAGYQLNVAVTKDIVFPGPYDATPAALPQAPGGLAPAPISDPYPSAGAGGQ